MADIFQEIDEDLRREKAGKLWQKYGRFVIALAVLIVLAVAAWRGWEWYSQREAQAAGARFEDALSLSRGGNTKEAANTLSGLVKDAPSGYRILARFRLAAETGRDNPVDGIKAFEALADDTSLGKTLQDLARIRAAYLAVDSWAYGDLATAIEPLTATGEPWRHAAREILGLAAWKAKDLTTASKWFEAVLVDKDVPSSGRQRAELMLQLISADSPAKAAS
jgi:hypothetical protein